jgi:hypothetical protein
MSEFSEFQKTLSEQIERMIARGQLFVTGVDKDKMWELYLNSFADGDNLIYKVRTEHDCSACRHFIKTFGNVVSIKNGIITSIWDTPLGETSKYTPVAKALIKYVKSQPIVDIFTTDTRNIGIVKNHKTLDDGTIITYEHFHATLPQNVVNCIRSTIDQIKGKARDLRDVFKRSLDEISSDSVGTVLELIAQNSLYKGEEWKSVLEVFQSHQKAYNILSDQQKELFAWEMAPKAGPVVGKIKNHSIGVLLLDISKGIDLDEAVRRYETIVAPTNYKRPKTIFTKRMLEEAEKRITELGYLDSLGRRFSTLEDITINNILFANRDVAKKLGVFEQMEKEISISTKKFDRIEEIPISTFVSEVRP